MPVFITWGTEEMLTCQIVYITSCLHTPPAALSHIACKKVRDILLKHGISTDIIIERNSMIPLQLYLLHLIHEHYDDVIMSKIASQITSLAIVYSTLYSGADQSKHQSSASLAFVRGIHRGPVNSPHKWPVTRKRFPFDDVIMEEMSYSELALQSYRLVNITDIHQLAHRKMVRKCWCSNINPQVVRCTSRHKSPRLVNGDNRTQEVFNNMPSGLALEVLHKCGNADVA